MSIRVSNGLGAVVCLALVGCGAKLNVTQTFTLPNGADIAHIVVPEPQKRDQKVTVTVDVTGDPVDVFVLKAADVPENIQNSDAEKKGFEGKALGSVRGTKSGNVSCTVPANTDYRVVVLLSGKTGTKTQGTVKLTN